MLATASVRGRATAPFAFYIRHLSASNHLPDYALTLEEDQAVFWRRGDGAGSSASRGHAAVRPLPAAAASTAPAERRIMVSSAAVERLYEFAPGWDKYMLESLYIA